MTKFLVVSIFVLTFPLRNIQAQNTSIGEIDVRLRAVFDEKYIESIRTDTFWIKKWQFYFTHRRHRRVA